ncbi:MAG: hypothetical protein R3Y05_01500 [bacterium]
MYDKETIEKYNFYECKKILVVSAKCMRENDTLELNNYYNVKEITMGQSNTSIILWGIKGCFNSVDFKFYIDNKEIDIYKSVAFNSYISKSNSFIYYKENGRVKYDSKN